MTIEMLARIGRLLYGEYWQRELAAALDVDDRTVRRWVAADSRIPHIEVDVMRLLHDRIIEIEAALAELPRDGVR